MESRISRCINFDWTSGYLPGIPSPNQYDSFMMTYGDDKMAICNDPSSFGTDNSPTCSSPDLTPGYRSFDSSYTATDKYGIALVNEHRDVEDNDEDEDDHDHHHDSHGYRDLSRGNSHSPPLRKGTRQPSMPSVNLEHHPHYTVSAHPRHRVMGKINSKGRSLLKKIGRRQGDDTYDNLARPENPLSKTPPTQSFDPDDPTPSAAALRLAASMPEMSSPEPYVSRPLPDVPVPQRDSSPRDATPKVLDRSDTRISSLADGSNGAVAAHSPNQSVSTPDRTSQRHEQATADKFGPDVRPSPAREATLPPSATTASAESERCRRSTGKYSSSTKHDVLQPSSGSQHSTATAWRQSVQTPPLTPPLSNSNDHGARQRSSDVFQTLDFGCADGRASRCSSDALPPDALTARINKLEQANMAMRASLTAALDRLSAVEPIALGFQTLHDRLTEVEKAIRASCITRLNQRSLSNDSLTVPKQRSISDDLLTPRPFRRTLASTAGASVAEGKPNDTPPPPPPPSDGPRFVQSAQLPTPLMYGVWPQPPVGMSRRTTCPSSYRPATSRASAQLAGSRQGSPRDSNSSSGSLRRL